MQEVPVSNHILVEAEWPEQEGVSVWNRFDLHQLVEAENSARKAVEAGAVRARIYTIVRTRFKTVRA